MKVKTDLAQLQGTWNIVSLEMEGKKYPPGRSQIVIEGSRFTSLNMGAEYGGTVSVDAARTPKTFDLAFDQGPEKGQTSLGIYVLDDDTWKICLGLTGRSRPEKFATAPGTGHALEILTRETPGARRSVAEKAAAAEQAPPVEELQGEWFMVRCEQDGSPLDPRFVKSARREFQGNATTLFVGGRSFSKTRIAVDRSTQPKSIDYLDQRQQGIYEVAGDTLHTCLAAAGGLRPADFTATPGDGRTVSEWRRRNTGDPAK